MRYWLIPCALVLSVLLAACGGDGSPTSPRFPSPTPNPTPAACPFALNVTPVAGFVGLYSVLPDPPGSYTIRVNGVARSVEFGQLVTAVTGDLVQGCRPCGCTEAVVIR